MRRLLQHTLAACAALSTLTFAARAQTTQPAASQPAAARRRAAEETADASSLAEVRQQLREQQAEIERLRETVAEQSRLLNELLSRTARAESAPAQTARPATVSGAAYTVDGVAATDTLARTTDALTRTTDAPARIIGAQQPGGAAAKNSESAREQQQSEVAQLKKTTEALSRQLGSIAFSGDVRLRYESQLGQLNALPNAENPAVIGNELSARHRVRLRARLSLRGRINDQFDWGLRFTTGTTPDVTSTNQTLTDFFSHKTFGLSQAYLTYRPSAVPGLRLQAGKFDTPWLYTELTLDNDIQPEGLNQTYSRDFKRAGALKNLTLVAWQLPLLERQAAFVLDPEGRVNVDATRRGGRDLALYGAQARARFDLSPKAALTVSAADLYFSGTQFITPAQFFGGQIQLPVTVTIPASGTGPARTVTGFASVPRDFLTSGSALGVSSASTNATNADGRLASGYNLVDLIGRLELTHNPRWPVTLLLNVVANTQARDVVSAGGVRLSNDENLGYWAEFQVGRTRERGDTLFGYTLIRIERDAILSPFNFSDVAQSTDVRAHRFVAAYAADPRVTLSLTGIVTQRPHGLLGAFGQTPLGSLNRATTRLQLDTTFRF